MKIGVLAFITETTVDSITFARKVESLGFDGFYLPEHPIIPVVVKSIYPGTPDGRLPAGIDHFIDPFIGLAQAAAVTSRIELGTGICLVPEHDPIILAKRSRRSTSARAAASNLVSAPAGWRRRARSWGSSSNAAGR